MDMTAIDYDLVTALVAHVALHGKNAGVVGGSAILVFLPGLAEITAAIESMRVRLVTICFLQTIWCNL